MNNGNCLFSSAYTNTVAGCLFTLLFRRYSDKNTNKKRDYESLNYQHAFEIYFYTSKL